MGAIAIPAQIVVGDVIARFDAEKQPAKFAAMEAVYHTQRGAPVTIGGIAHADHIDGAIEIPKALSLLVAGNTTAEVTGLDRVPADEHPPVFLTHFSFDAMVGSGSALLLIAVAWLVTVLRRRELPRWLAIVLVAGAPLALIALEAGWCVTEFGRQPWIAHGLLRTTDAATIAPGVDIAFYGFSFIYMILAATCWWLLRQVDSEARL
jgi:cytochrome bd ubiquinol oxidase subunit I